MRAASSADCALSLAQLRASKTVLHFLKNASLVVFSAPPLACPSLSLSPGARVPGVRDNWVCSPRTAPAQSTSLGSAPYLEAFSSWSCAPSNPCLPLHPTTPCVLSLCCQAVSLTVDHCWLLPSRPSSLLSPSALPVTDHSPAAHLSPEVTGALGWYPQPSPGPASQLACVPLAQIIELSACLTAQVGTQQTWSGLREPWQQAVAAGQSPPGLRVPCSSGVREGFPQDVAPELVRRPAQSTRQTDHVCQRPVPAGAQYFVGCGTFQEGWHSGLEGWMEAVAGEDPRSSPQGLVTMRGPLQG